MCPIPNLPLIGENITCTSSFQTKRFKCSKNTHHRIKLLVNIWNHGENVPDLPGQNDRKNVGLV